MRIKTLPPGGAPEGVDGGVGRGRLVPVDMPGGL